jgi:hypothetical protein
VEAGAEGYSPLVPEHILMDQLLKSVVDPVAVPADCRCLGRIQPADSLPDILETKRRKRRLPVGVLVPQEVFQGLEIAIKM